MILHLGYELPVKEERTLDSASPVFTSEETRIIKSQIRKNMKLIDDHVRRIDLFVNHEHHPERGGFVEKLRDRLFLLMEENDTFREVLWKQCQSADFFLEKNKIKP